MRAAVTWFDGGEWRDGVMTATATDLRLLPDAPTTGLPRIDGVITGGFTDHHVHLQLIDPAPLADSVLDCVIDLGGNPDVLSEAAHNSGVLTQTRAAETESALIGKKSPELYGGRHGVRGHNRLKITYAGAFLTPPGGYPSDRAWAPAGSVREIGDADAAEHAIAEMKDAGAARIKVASNGTTGPVFSDEMFRTIVRIAAHHRLPVVAHAEGRGEAQRVVRLGAERLAHAPFSERLTNAEIAQQAASASWISTLAIHTAEAYDIAVHNVRRFHAAGGSVVYGTDMGNGLLPVGLNPQEIVALRAAGIDGTNLLQALSPADPRDPDTRLLLFPGQSPDSVDPLRARLLIHSDLKV